MTGGVEEDSIETRIVDSDLPRGVTAVPHEQAEHPFQPMTQSRQWQCMQLLRKGIDRIYAGIMTREV